MRWLLSSPSGWTQCRRRHGLMRTDAKLDIPLSADAAEDLPSVSTID
jgi:hypothetical protein